MICSLPDEFLMLRRRLVSDRPELWEAVKLLGIKEGAEWLSEKLGINFDDTSRIEDWCERAMIALSCQKGVAQEA